MIPLSQRDARCRPQAPTHFTPDDDLILKDLALVVPRISQADIAQRFHEATGKPASTTATSYRVQAFRKEAGWSGGHPPTARNDTPAEGVPSCADCGNTEAMIARGNADVRWIDGTRFGFTTKICRRCYKRHLAHAQRDQRVAATLARESERSSGRRTMSPREFSRVLAEIRAEQGIPIGGVEDPAIARQRRYAELARQERQRTIESRRATA